MPGFIYLDLKIANHRLHFKAQIGETGPGFLDHSTRSGRIIKIGEGRERYLSNGNRCDNINTRANPAGEEEEASELGEGEVHGVDEELCSEGEEPLRGLRKLGGGRGRVGGLKRTHRRPPWSCRGEG